MKIGGLILTPDNRKPRVFVGSSVESLRYAQAIQENLDPFDADVKVWPQGVFELSSNGLDSLLEAVKSNDFGVFIFAADDVVIIKDQQHGAVRDNVIFELGLFMGGLGRDRAFVVTPIGVDLHLPTDLEGLNTAHYDPRRKDLPGAMGAACSKIRRAIERLGIFAPGASTSEIVSLADPVSSSSTLRPLDLARIRKQII
jgi:predicted nucleotide-binding protein